MKFKITCGKNASNINLDNGLKTVFSDSKLIVQLSDGYDECKDVDGSMLFIIGNVIGIRDSNGLLANSNISTKEILYKIKNNNIEYISSKLEGRFIIIYIDKTSNCYVARDRFAKIDIYKENVSGTVLLASDLSLLDKPQKEGYDQAALVHTLTYYGFRPPKKHTIYNAVTRIGVDESLEVINGKFKINKNNFSALPIENYTESSLKEYSEIFLSHLEHAGSKEGNIVYLSSGWDSTSILAGLVHIFGKSKVRSIIGRMRYSERSGVCNQFEIDRTKKISDYFGTKLDMVDFEFLDNGPDFIQKYAPIMRDHQSYSTTLLSHGLLAEEAAKISSGKETIFAGEISDGAHNLGFSQYATIFHPMRDFQEYSDKMKCYLFGPTFHGSIRDGSFKDDFIYKLFKKSHGDDVFDDVNTDINKRTGQLLTSFFLRNARMPFWSLDNVKSLTKYGREYYTEEMFNVYLMDASEQASSDNLYAWYLHLYNSFHWQGSTVNTLSLFCDEHNLKSDLPFWDCRLQDFLSSMPEEWGRGLALNNTKYPLKWMLRNSIDYPYQMQEGPHAYIYDVDSSFNHTFEVYYHSKMKEVYQDALRDKSYHHILSSEVFNLDYYDEIVDAYLSNEELPVSKINELWPLVNLCLYGWY